MNFYAKNTPFAIVVLSYENSREIGKKRNWAAGGAQFSLPFTTKAVRVGPGRCEECRLLVQVVTRICRLIGAYASFTWLIHQISTFPKRVYLCIIVRLSRFFYGLHSLIHSPYMVPTPAANCPTNLDLQHGKETLYQRHTGKSVY